MQEAVLKIEEDVSLMKKKNVIALLMVAIFTIHSIPIVTAQSTTSVWDIVSDN
jgi:hypothetical protein